MGSARRSWMLVPVALQRESFKRVPRGVYGWGIHLVAPVLFASDDL